MRIFYCLFIFFIHNTYAQTINQTIRGRIVDKESKFPLLGVVVSVEEQTEIAVATDADGYYKLDGVLIGRRTFKFSYLGYKPVYLQNILVSSAKELVLNVDMEESIKQLDEVTISATRKENAVNDMAIISARSFTVEEANKFAASRQDPARMAGNFAGVNSTSDARNDIVIRGNSPMGLLWRLNGIDIPNPSHFAIAGSTGGPLSIINTKFLSTSDFMTGAFPAEYGNAVAGVFDLSMRNGNIEKHEFTGQIGILGLELAAEGPLNKTSKASYLATFRYSTLEALQGLKLKIGTDAVPKYFDGSFKLNFPTKKLGTFSLFSIGGASTIDINLSDTVLHKPSDLKKKSSDPDLYGDQTRDQYFRTNMLVIGLQNTFSINTRTFLSSTFSHSVQNIYGWHDFIYRDTNFRPASLKRILGTDQQENRSSTHISIHKKLSNRNSFKAGIVASIYNFSLTDSIRLDSLSLFRVRANIKSTFFMLQPYLQWKYKISEKITFHAGIHGQYLSINSKSVSFEPRAGINYNFKPNQTISFGYGIHSQMQPAYIYFARANPSSDVLPNKNLGFSRSQHFIMSYDYVIRKDIRIKIETYYQYLWNIPVYPFASGVSLINQGASFTRFFPKSEMLNNGLGRNYGVEFTLEKFFTKNYYILWTTSLYQSEYKASDGKWRNTDFNGNYITNILAGYEIPVGKKKLTTIITGTKFSFAGGRRFSRPDIDSSNKYLDYQPKEGEINEQQFGPYARFDLRLGFRINAKRLTHEFIIDLINVTGRKNPLALAYAPNPANPSRSFIINNQLGFLPLVYYKLDF